MFMKEAVNQILTPSNVIILYTAVQKSPYGETLHCKI